jgi:hypothetical protein
MTRVCPIPVERDARSRTARSSSRRRLFPFAASGCPLRRTPSWRRRGRERAHLMAPPSLVASGHHWPASRHRSSLRHRRGPTPRP